MTCGPGEQPLTVLYQHCLLLIFFFQVFFFFLPPFLTHSLTHSLTPSILFFLPLHHLQVLKYINVGIWICSYVVSQLASCAVYTSFVLLLALNLFQNPPTLLYQVHTQLLYLYTLLCTCPSSLPIICTCRRVLYNNIYIHIYHVLYCTHILYAPKKSTSLRCVMQPQSISQLSTQYHIQCKIITIHQSINPIHQSINQSIIHQSINPSIHPSALSSPHYPTCPQQHQQ